MVEAKAIQIDWMKALEQRFWPKVDRIDLSGCWIWAGAKNDRGYGQIYCSELAVNMVGAHRASWIISKGAVPQGMDVLHKCDNPACVNPEHLFLGTALENVADMILKGRKNQPKGHSIGSSKLSLDDVITIKAALKQWKYGMSTALAKQFGVSPSSIYAIRLGQSWAWVGDEKCQ